VKQSSTNKASFSVSLREEHLIIIKKATEALLAFSTSYLCVAGFSTLNTMKSKNRSRLQTLEEDLRLCLSTIRSRTRNIMRLYAAQVSHWHYYVYTKTFSIYSCLYLRNIFPYRLYTYRK
jgi:hypothetical protein